LKASRQSAYPKNRFTARTCLGFVFKSPVWEPLHSPVSAATAGYSVLDSSLIQMPMLIMFLLSHRWASLRYVDGRLVIGAGVAAVMLGSLIWHI
jgi:hypothetical protein